MFCDVFDINVNLNLEVECKMYCIVIGFDGYIFNIVLEYEVFYNYGWIDVDIILNLCIEDRYFVVNDVVIDLVIGNVVCCFDLDSFVFFFMLLFLFVNVNFGFLIF